MIKKVSFFLILMMMGIIGLAETPSLDEYGLGNKEEVAISYLFEGGESPFRYAKVEIQGTGKAVCAFQFQGTDEPEYRKDIVLPESFIGALIKQYASMDFLSFNYQAVTLDGSQVIDAGMTTIGFQYKDQSRKIIFSAIKTIAVDQVAKPINADAQKLQELIDSFWKIINQHTYLVQLEKYRLLKDGELANLLSSLSADARMGRLLNPREFVPRVMEIISDERLAGAVGSYAAVALEEFGVVPFEEDQGYAKWWLDWWGKNKDVYQTH